MNKRIVYISYLIIFFVIFNFAYGITDWIASWQFWHWYLLVLCGVIAGLLYLKHRQNEKASCLQQEIRESERIRMQLNQLLLFEQLKNQDDNSFNDCLKKVYELKGFHSIEITPEESGYNLLLWRNGRKFILKWFKMVPLMTHLYKEETLQFGEGELVALKDVREAFGAMKDYDTQADELILLSTSHFEEAAAAFALRNGINLVNGEDFYSELEKLREPAVRGVGLLTGDLIT